ncbi:hypothetical protein ABZW96_36440 [Nocardia sp. NPDC004168]|uniref:hypothetical protein n=1 Tax=Nocardia sp. NPDC004168 TaxID=3154452 RepID=UPI0033AD8066
MFGGEKFSLVKLMLDVRRNLLDQIPLAGRVLFSEPPRSAASFARRASGGLMETDHSGAESIINSSLKANKYNYTHDVIDLERIDPGIVGGDILNAGEKILDPVKFRELDELFRKLDKIGKGDDSSGCRSRSYIQRVLRHTMSIQNFDRSPALVSSNSIRRVVEAGGLELHGLNLGSDYLQGPRGGTGLVAWGMHATTNKERARSWAGKSDVLAHMVLLPGARHSTFQNLQTEMELLREKLAQQDKLDYRHINERLNNGGDMKDLSKDISDLKQRIESRDNVLTDVSVYATLRGDIDAYQLDGPVDNLEHQTFGSGHGFGSGDGWIVLNRSWLAVVR